MNSATLAESTALTSRENGEAWYTSQCPPLAGSEALPTASQPSSSSKQRGKRAIKLAFTHFDGFAADSWLANYTRIAMRTFCVRIFATKLLRSTRGRYMEDAFH